MLAYNSKRLSNITDSFEFNGIPIVQPTPIVGLIWWLFVHIPSHD